MLTNKFKELYDETHFFLWTLQPIFLTHHGVDFKFNLTWDIDEELVIEDFEILSKNDAAYWAIKFLDIDYISVELTDLVYNTLEYQQLLERFEKLLSNLKDSFSDEYKELISFVEEDPDNKKEKFILSLNS